jgi:xanthine dehydrogenase large subunit
MGMRLKGMDLAAVHAAPGVVAVFTAADIPGENNVGPVAHDEPAARRRTRSSIPASPVPRRRDQHPRPRAAAARKAVFDLEPLPAFVSIADADAAQSLIEATQRMARGDAAAALPPRRTDCAATLEIGGQEHFYLEGQVALATPGEAGQVHVLSSTQHPSEVQHLIANLLGLNHADVTVEVRRMGGAFGGKETQAASVSAARARWSRRRPDARQDPADRDDDMAMTGKRHDFVVGYDVGFDDDGRIEAIRIDLARAAAPPPIFRPRSTTGRCSMPTIAIICPRSRSSASRLKTHTVSNTAFRGFGGPQGWSRSSG